MEGVLMTELPSADMFVRLACKQPRWRSASMPCLEQKTSSQEKSVDW